MEIILEQGKRMMGNFIYTQYPYLWLYQSLLFGKTASLNAVDAINGSDVPVLIIHGSEDDFVEFEGSSIISKVNNITNPNIRSLALTDPGSNGHNNLFRSDASRAYIDDLNKIYRELYDQYEQNIPYEVKQDFYSKVDRTLAQDINRELMDEIQAFFMESIER
jgi:hypothetical protein